MQNKYYLWWSWQQFWYRCLGNFFILEQSRRAQGTFGSSKKCMSCFFIKSCLKESDSNDNLYVIGFAIRMGSGVRFLHKWTGLQHSCHRMTVYHQSWTAIHFPPSLLHPQGILSAVLNTCVYTPTCQRKICSSPDHRHTQIRRHFSRTLPWWF